MEDGERAYCLKRASSNCVDAYRIGVPNMPKNKNRKKTSRQNSYIGKAGHLAVMAIFSRDGYVRFVRLDQNLEIEIYGERVENHAPGIYRLTNLNY